MVIGIAVAPVVHPSALLTLCHNDYGYAMHTRPLARSLLLMLAVAALGAAEVTFFDLRLAGGILSDHYKGSSTTTVISNSDNVSTSSDSGDDGRDSDHNYRGQIQFVWGYLGPAGGLILGAGVGVNYARFDNGAQEADVTTPVVDVLIGYGIAVTPEWHFELAPFAGAGRTYYSVRDNGSSSTSKEWSKYVEYGAKLGTYYTFNQSLQVGVEVPYLVGRFDPEYNHDDDNNSYSVSDSRRNQGFGLLVSLGQRF